MQIVSTPTGWGAPKHLSVGTKLLKMPLAKKFSRFVNKATFGSSNIKMEDFLGFLIPAGTRLQS